MGDGKALAHGYKILQHWNQWLSQHFLGASLLQAEEQLLTHLLPQCFGKHVLLIGAPHQASLLNSTTISCRTLLSPLISHDIPTCYIESDIHELPVLTGSIDLVILPHTLELVDNPRQLLFEACRIIKPEGLIVICGFNPYSAWGLRKVMNKHKLTPWKGNFISAARVKNWLHLADFVLEDHRGMMFRPPVSQQALYDKLHFLEKLSSPFLGGAYALVARAKVIPLTPIRLQWKQQLGGIRISTTIPGHIARHVR